MTAISKKSSPWRTTATRHLMSQVTIITTKTFEFKQFLVCPVNSPKRPEEHPKQAYKAAQKQILMPMGWMNPQPPKHRKYKQIAMRNTTANSTTKISLWRTTATCHLRPQINGIATKKKINCFWPACSTSNK